ncbi:hypothetical protein ACIRQP_20130 [Streptomyces sp. NPDC102274]|uniref:hypothetical protein n=1 Tax=Streptomyces sp. NPDC102274 TaxID=3366151 RepID=UPI0037F33455
MTGVADDPGPPDRDVASESPLDSGGKSMATQTARSTTTAAAASTGNAARRRM